jgi:RHS repeat-associated protein
VTSSPTGFNCTGQDTTCTAAFDASATVTLTATPDTGQVFLGWGGACAGTDTTCVVTAADALLVTAAFGAGSSATLTYYHVDALGSVRAITDTSNTTMLRHDYRAFGESTSLLTGDARRYIGGELDPETAFEYLGARYYRNLWGRFTSVDPIVSPGATTNPQLWNRYTYGLNSPLRFSDPSGMEPGEPTDRSSALPDMACDFCGNAETYNSWLFQQSFRQLTRQAAPAATPNLYLNDIRMLIGAIYGSQTGSLIVKLGAIAYSEGTKGALDQYMAIVSVAFNRINTPEGYLHSVSGSDRTLDKFLVQKEFKSINNEPYKIFMNGTGQATASMLNALSAALIVFNSGGTPGTTTTATAYVWVGSGESYRSHVPALGSVEPIPIQVLRSSGGDLYLFNYKPQGPRR